MLEFGRKISQRCKILSQKNQNVSHFKANFRTCQKLNQYVGKCQIYNKILYNQKNYNMSKIVSWILECCYNFLKLFTQCRCSFQKIRSVIFRMENFTTCQTLNQNNYNVSEFGSNFYKVADFEIKAPERVGFSSQLFTSFQKLQENFYNDINVLNYFFITG